ncbi:hypothetical protein [Nocardioides lianchengensis]|uniref:Uncharacterized protein n=1 Tax=Nocardioides lianchengensis TaxID=1045774 RepID=A0A1G6W2E8_9ACTN|nr:hypothetical protein [Nocardioides lianchengensis]NYG09489.1 hypothetical protein [Nocardioides lianchengensis]SDD59236.1 hypothetical protein SAMN05421872_109119 [Nocardioides lianchengensis]
MTPLQRTSIRTSRRLRPGVELYAAADGHLLRVGDTHHHVHLDDAAAAELLDALAEGGDPASGPARAALEALVAAGLVDVPPARLRVDGDGVLAAALRAALTRMGAVVGPGGGRVLARDDDALPADATTACWVVGHRVVLSPPAVPAPQVAARRRAATRHRAADPRTAPAAGARRVAAAVPLLGGAGLELAAVQVAAELLRPDRPAHEVVAVDLRALTVSRHPVLPVPAAPR